MQHISIKNCFPKYFLCESSFHLPKREDLTKACNILGVSASGSISDIINRLEELLLYKDVYPNMFVKLKKLEVESTHGMHTWSGVLCITIMVARVRSGSWDAQLSFKHPSTVYIQYVSLLDVLPDI
ncbi:hypothetical protein G5714_002799 [Onychostoma macrolepis]|uniref:Uncharacterized protein n=1 Tax=Onychostoma macrolepis TaxID=369639 RepID=A0A7J6D7S8_9TELE|nr:hypothetical protein G5714_002799 [Onychostoma macrolepis]